MEGILIINKPNGVTSHDVVMKIRRKFGLKRVGHAGTLDPLATGILIILLGKSTKLFNQFVGLDKAYRATLVLGTKTDSADTQGKVIEHKPYAHLADAQIKSSFAKFIGEIEQVPPMVSAVKVGGKKLYELARKGITIEREARQVKIDCLKIEEINPPSVRFYLECSKGTYVRQLAEDIGEDLGCGACISQIQRVKVGSFILNDAIEIEDAHESHIRPGKI